MGPVQSLYDAYPSILTLKSPEIWMGQIRGCNARRIVSWRGRGIGTKYCADKAFSNRTRRLDISAPISGVTAASAACRRWCRTCLRSQQQQLLLRLQAVWCRHVSASVGLADLLLRIAVNPRPGGFLRLLSHWGLNRSLRMRDRRRLRQLDFWIRIQNQLRRHAASRFYEPVGGRTRRLFIHCSKA